MLTTLARRVHQRRSLLRSVVTVVAVALGVIFGLLAMHSMNTHAMPSGHSNAVAVGSVAETHHEHTAPAASLPTDDNAGCVGCSEDHGTTWMACVLALLVAVVLLARPGAWRHSLWQPRTPPHSSWVRLTEHPLRPPSLTVLCISRT